MNERHFSIPTSKAINKVLQREWLAYRALVKESRKLLSEPHVHDLRVQIQRFLATLELSGTNDRSLRKQLKKTKKQMSPLRDVQVELAFLKDNSADEGLNTFKKHLEKREAKLITKVKKHLRRISLSEQKNQLNGPTRIARSEINGHVRTLLLRYKKDQKASLQGKPETLHRLRLDAKHLRYLGEAQKSILGVTDVNLPLVKKTQTILGRLQDETELLKNIDHFIENKRHLPNPALKTLKHEIAIKQKKLLKVCQNQC